MFPIFKLYHASGKDDIRHIYVFLNNDWIEENNFTIEASIEELNAAIKGKRKESLLFIFQEEELDRIFLQHIGVSFLPQTLHIDDTITMIKSKIIEETKLDISLPEIYLFGIREEKLNPQYIYDKLTQDGEIPLTKERLMQYLQNFVRFNIEDFKRLEKDEYTHEDILPFTEKKELIKFPIGQKFILEKQYPFMVSPFDFFIADPILEKHGDKITSTENENLLLQYGDIYNNNIYFLLRTRHIK